MRQNKIHDFTLADQDWIGRMSFKNFADQDWTRTEKFHSPLISVTDLRYRRSRYKRIQLYRSDLQEASGPIRTNLKKLVSGQIVIFRANFFSPPAKCLPVRLWLSCTTLSYL